MTNDRKHRGYKPPDLFRKQNQYPEIKNLYQMKLAERIYLAQVNDSILKSKI